MLSKPTGPIAFKTLPSREKPQGDLKRNGKHWLEDNMKKTNEPLDKAQAQYKKNYDARLPNQ